MKRAIRWLFRPYFHQIYLFREKGIYVSYLLHLKRDIYDVTYFEILMIGTTFPMVQITYASSVFFLSDFACTIVFWEMQLQPNCVGFIAPEERYFDKKDCTLVLNRTLV